MSLLSAPNPEWPALAEREIQRWTDNVPGVIALHHIGSTSVPGLPAKPIIDLLCVFESEVAQESASGHVENLGYEWLGEYGLAGRSYSRRDDPETGRRLVQAHGYVTGHPDIRRHLAFRDALRAQPSLRAGYTSIKSACAARHPSGGRDYGVCKSGWIDKVEALALERTE